MRIQKISNNTFSGIIKPEDEMVTIIPNYKKAMEEAAQKVGFYDNSYQIQSRVNKFKKNGNKVKTYFQKDGKTPSYNVELTSQNKKVRSILFGKDGKTKLVETLYDKLGNAIKSLYYKKDGVTVFMEKIHQAARK